MKHYLSIGMAAIVLALPSLLLLGGCATASSDSGARAAIIDQFSELRPGQAFTDAVKAALETNGFQVDVYQGDEISVKLYAELPRYGYKLIIFRAHAGVMLQAQGSDVVEKESTYLFTSEAYSNTKYIREQLTDQMAQAKMARDDVSSVFAISPKFLLNSLKARFDNAAIIMMGCSGIYRLDMAEAFIQEGASTYLGWDGTVDLDYADNAIINLIDNLSDKGMTLDGALSETLAEIGKDPYYGSYLKYYPKESGGHTLKELASG